MKVRFFIALDQPMLKPALLAALPASVLLAQPLYAQSITATPDGTGTIIQYQGNTYHIQGGTQAGGNLFHSFQDFGLSSGEIANFLSNPLVINIFGRVTGGNASLIDGLIQANPNLYLMNPAGIVFGANASLNVGGDFFATTAEQIGFSSGWFNATGANDYETLIGAPNQFAFLNEQPGAILNFGDLSSSSDLNLVGGTVLNQGSLVSAGNVTMAAVPGERLVNLAQDGMLLSLDLPQDSVETGITPVDLPTLLTGSGRGNAPVLTPSGSGATTGGSPLQGDVVIAGTVQGEQVDLYAAGQVTPTDVELVQGDITVVRFPGADGQTVLSIIDAHADNAQDLLFGGAPGTIATIVQDTENGIEAVSETLNRIEQPLDGMSITAEGNEGNFWLGNTWITHETVQDYQEQLAQWSSAFKENADLLLYSCFTALGARGEALIARLVTGTGLDVAASTNATGSANHGGDWVLEHSTGNIETQTPFTDETLANWDGKLATFTVQNGNDSGADSLREEISNANGSGGADEIRFANGVTLVSLTTGQLQITDELTITGGNTRVTIAGNNTTFRIFDVTGGVATTFDNLTITGGQLTGGNGGGINSNGAVTVTNSTVSGNSTNFQGGGIFSNGAVTLTNSTVSGNSSDNQGGGITSYSAITLTNSTVSGNSASSSGGGMLSFNNVTLTNSTVSGNSTALGGGGIAANGAVTVTNSTVSGNSANNNNGGIFGGGAVTLTNSTVSGNSAGGLGGGVRSTNTVTLTNSTVSGNSANNNGGGIFSPVAVTLTNSILSDNSSAAGGGGIFNQGDVTLSNSTISGNSALSGGGISSNGAVTLTGSTVSNNLASVNIGGILAVGDVTLTNSTVSGNSTNVTAGGIQSNGAVTLTSSTVSSNSSSNVGGILSVGAVTLTNSTVSSNSSGSNGGGIFSLDVVTATNSTIAFNSAAGNGGGIYTLNQSSLDNTIVANNSAGGTAPDLFGTFTVNFSLILDSSGATITGSNNILGQDPLLGPLQNNGGSTATHALLSGSPALNSGNNALVTTTTDQRGEVRIFNGTVDIGAYEFVPVPVVTLSVTARSDFETQIQGLTAACRTIPEVELEAELPPEPSAEPEWEDDLERNERCLPVVGN